MTRYWIGVACKEHVQKGVQEGFAQVCHGKPGPLNRMKEGDLIIYYSPTLKFGGKEPYRAFTAIGKVQAGESYTFVMSVDFVPWRRDVNFFKAQDALIEPLLDKLSFIKDKKRWGFPFRQGFLKISQADFWLIATEMGVFNE